MARPQLTDISGVGPGLAGLLREHGLSTPEALARAALTRIMAVPGFGAARAKVAKAAATDAVGFGSNRSIQIHGGIGFTWECYVHLYVKRQLHSQVMLGDAVYQRRKLAELVLA